MKWRVVWLFGLLMILTTIGSVAAANSLTEFPVRLTPKTNGSLQPGTTFQYNFIFSSTVSCDVLLNVSSTVTTDAYGVGFATLNISGLGPTPHYLCEYRNGNLRAIHTLNPNIFESNNNLTEIKALGFNTTTELDSRYYSSTNPYNYLNSTSVGYNKTAWDTAYASILTLPQISSNIGNYSADAATICRTDGTNCPASAGNSSWNETRGNSIYYLRTDGNLDNATWNETRATALFYPLVGNPSGFLTSYTETDPLWSGNQSRVTGLETSNSTLFTNASAQQTTINNLLLSNTTLFTNNSGQQTSINQLLTENTSLWSNASSQATQLGNILLSNSTLFSNASSQQTTINNLVTENGTLYINASGQQTSINNALLLIGNGMSVLRINTTGNSTPTNLTNNTVIEFLAGTGMTATHVGSRVTYATTITQYSDALAAAASATANGNWSADKSSYNTTAQNKILFLQNNGTLTANQWCQWSSNGINCNVAPVVDTNSGYTVWRLNTSSNSTNNNMTNNTLLELSAGAGLTINHVGGKVTFTNTITQYTDALAAAASATANGNWSADKGSYSTTAQEAALYAGIGNTVNITTKLNNASTSRINVSGAYNALNLTIPGNSITGTDIDESTLATVPSATSATSSTQLNGQISTYYLNTTGFAAENLTSGTVNDARLAAAITRDIEWDTIGEVQTIWGVTLCRSDGTGCPTGTSDNTSWNQSYANTLYAPLSTVSSAGGWTNTSTLVSTASNTANVSIDGNTTFFDVTNNRVGINVINGKPTQALEVNGSINISLSNGCAYINGWQYCGNSTDLVVKNTTGSIIQQYNGTATVINGNDGSKFCIGSTC